MKQTQKESSNMGMKRSRELDMATCLMLLSRVSDSAKIKRFSTDSDRVFTCKTCDREFSSFQALGGHRASHKKPRVAEGEAVKTKTHECSICGLEFAIGQALGGHMRKHRNAAVSTESSDQDQDPTPVAVMNRCSSKRVVCLDLNLTPLENDLKLHLGLML